MTTDSATNRLGPFGILWRATLALMVVAPLSIVYMALCVVLMPFRVLRIWCGNQYGKLVGRTVYGLAGIKPVIEDPGGHLGSGQVMYVCNHTSTADMWVGMWMCPVGTCGVAKKELVWIPFFGQAYLLSGHLLLDRGNRERAIASMARARDVVQKNRLSIWMWPEGTRSQDGRLQPMKKGFVHLAIGTGLPLVPLVFHDADLRWHTRTMRISPGALRIEVLPPIDTSKWKAETATEHAEELWQLFQNKLGARQRGIRD